jgi:hypothetical protein
VFENVDQVANWLIETWKSLQPKDEITWIVSALSFLLAGMSFVYTIYSKRRDASVAARNDLHSCISKISEGRAEKDTKIRELGNEYNSLANMALRTAINDKIKLYLSKAVLLTTTYKRLDVTSFENVLLGAALFDEGKSRQSLRFYRRAVWASTDDADKAVALRVYGRALIEAGHPIFGRWRMLKAAKLFSALSKTRGYNEGRMNYECADTYSRLVAMQLQCNYRKNVSDDNGKFEESIRGIRDHTSREAMKQLFERYNIAITGSGPVTADAPELGEPPAAPGSSAGRTAIAGPATVTESGGASPGSSV